MDHFEDEDFGRRRRPRNTTYVGSYRRPGRSRYFNPASDILEGIEKTEKTIGERKTKVRDFENAASQRRLELMQSLRETETMEDTDAMNDLQAELSKMVDDAYRLDIASFEGDRSSYNKKQSDLNNVLGNLPTIMGLIDAEGEAMKKAEESGTDYVKKILRDNNEDYVAFVEDASKGGKNIGFRIEGGNVIAQLNGEDVFNANAYVKAKKNGVDLVNYAKDYSEQLAAVDKKAFEGLNKYITKESITRIKNGTATTQEKENYKEALDLYTKRLEESDLLTPLLNESTYQTYTNYGTGGDADSNDAWSNSDMQRAATKQAMAEKLIEDRFPRTIGGEEDEGVITTSTTVKDSEKIKAAQVKAASDKEIKQLELAFKQNEINKFEEGLENFVSRNIYHSKKAFEMPEGKQRNKEIVRLINEAGKGDIGEFTLEDGVILDGAGEPMTGIETKFGLLDYLNKLTVLNDLTGDPANQAKTYIGKRTKELGYPTQAEYQANLKAAKSGDVVIMPDGTKIIKK